jgi:DNA-binding MarR family transcriptional regulator
MIVLSGKLATWVGHRSPTGEVRMDQLASSVRGLVEAIEAYRRAVAEVLGLGASEINALVDLWFHGPCIPRTLADRLGLTSAGVTSLVDRLEASGLAVRCKHPTDRRSMLIELTETGATTLRAIVGIVDGHIASAAGDTKPEYMRELDRLLKQIEALLRASTADHASLAADLGHSAIARPLSHDGLDGSRTADLPRSTRPLSTE